MNSASCKAVQLESLKPHVQKGLEKHKRRLKEKQTLERDFGTARKILSRNNDSP